MNLPYSKQIDEPMCFSEEEEKLLTDSLNGIAKLLVNTVGREKSYTSFTIWAESKETLKQAQTLLGKAVGYIYEGRKNKKHE